MTIPNRGYFHHLEEVLTPEFKLEDVFSEILGGFCIVTDLNFFQVEVITPCSEQYRDNQSFAKIAEIA